MLHGRIQMVGETEAWVNINISQAHSYRRRRVIFDSVVFFDNGQKCSRNPLANILIATDFRGFRQEWPQSFGGVFNDVTN